MSNKKILKKVGSSALSMFIALVVAFFVSTNNINAYIGTGTLIGTSGISINNMLNCGIKSGVNWTIHSTTGETSYYYYTDNSSNNINIPAHCDYIIVPLDFFIDQSNSQYTNTYLLYIGANSWLPSNLLNIQYSFTNDPTTQWINECYHIAYSNTNEWSSYFNTTNVQGNVLYAKLIFTPSNSAIYFSSFVNNIYSINFDNTTANQNFLLNSINSKMSYLNSSSSSGGSSIDYSTVLGNILTDLNNIKNYDSSSSEGIVTLTNQMRIFLNDLPGIETSLNNIITDCNAIISRLNTLISSISNIDTNLSIILSNQQTILNNLTNLINNGNLTNEKLQTIINQLSDISNNIGDIIINVGGGNVTINQITKNYNNIVNNYSTVNNYLTTKLEPLSDFNTNITNGNYNLPDNIISVVSLPVNFINKLYSENSKIQILFWLPLLLMLIYLIIGRKRND